MASSLELPPFDADMLRDINIDLLQGSDATEGFDFDLDHLPPLHSSSGASVEVRHPPRLFRPCSPLLAPQRRPNDGIGERRCPVFCAGRTLRHGRGRRHYMAGRRQGAALGV